MNRHRLLVLAALPLVISCGGGASSTGVEIAPNVTVIADALAAKVIVAPDRLEIPAAGNEWLLKLRQGQILVSGHDAGFLRRVASVSRVGDLIVIPTLAAGLGDVIRKGKLSTRLDLMPGAPAMTPGATTRALVGDDITTGIDVGGTELFKNDKTSIKIGQGTIRMTPEVQLDAAFDNGLKYLEAGVSGEVEAALTLVIDSTETHQQMFERSLWKSQPRYYWHLVGVVPVVEEVTLSLGARFEVQLDCGVALEAGVSASGSVNAAVRYENGVSTPRYTNTLTASTIGPTFQRSLNASAKVTLRPRVDVKFYALAGPFLETAVGFKATIALAPVRQWEIAAVTEAIFGGQLQVLGQTEDAGALLDKSIMTEPVTNEWIIASDTLAGNGMPLGCGVDGGSDGGSAGDGGDDGGTANDGGAAADAASDTSPETATSDAMTDAPSADQASDAGGSCMNVGPPPAPDVGHMTFDNESAAGPLPSCGKALDLSGGATRMANFGADMTTGPFTLSVWFRSLSTGTTSSMILTTSQGVELAPAWSLFLYGIAGSCNSVGTEDLIANAYSGGFFNRLTLAPNGVTCSDTSWMLRTGTWYHIAWTFDGTTYRLYRDGRLVASLLSQRDTGATGSPLRIGGHISTLGVPTGQLDFSGQIDDLRIYRRAVTDQEVRALSCSCRSATDGGADDVMPPEDAPTKPDQSVTDVALADVASDTPLLSCLDGDGGIFVPPFPCDAGKDASSNADYVVCAANCQSAWISSSATGGAYRALDICKSRGYQRLGSFGTTDGAVCGAMELGTSCSNLGQRTFNGMGALGGGSYGNAVHWECLP